MLRGSSQTPLTISTLIPFFPFSINFTRLYVGNSSEKYIYFFLFFLFRWSLPLDSVRMKKQVFIKGEAALGTTYLFTRSFPVHQSSLCKWFMKDQASKDTHLNNETWPATTVLLTIWLPKMNFRSYLLLYSSYASKQRSCLIFLRWFDLILPVNKI